MVTFIWFYISKFYLLHAVLLHISVNWRLQIFHCEK